MFSVLDGRASGVGLSPGQVYIWVMVNLMQGSTGNPAMDYYPIHGGVVMLLLQWLHATETGISSGLMSH